MARDPLLTGGQPQVVNIDLEPVTDDNRKSWGMVIIV